MDKLKIATKLKLLLLLPLIGLLFLGSTLIYERYQSYNEYKILNNSVILSTKITSLVHELQKERGMTAGFLGSNGKKFREKLPTQRELTNQKREEFKNFLQTISTTTFGINYNDMLNDAIRRLSKLEDIRNKVSSLNIKGKDAIAYYTKMNGTFLEVVRDSSSLSPNNAMTKQLNAYTNFLLAKERAGIERAIGAITFTLDKFLPGMKLKFNRLISEQDAYIHSFENLANKETLEFYKKTLRGKAVEEVNRMRKIALTSVENRNFGVDGYYWFTTITTKINMLKKIDDQIASNLINKANELAGVSRNEMIFYIILSLLIVGTTIVLGQLVARNIIDGIRTLSSGLEDFFKFLNKETNDAKLIDLKREDAVGIMANKINENITKTKDVILDDMHFLQEVKDTVSMIKKGYLYQRLEYNAKSSNLEELKNEINTMLETMNKTIGGSVNKITDVLNSYTNLDFTNNIKNAQGSVELSILNVGNMITKMLKSNKENGLTIESSSINLLENVDNLNISSNEAAASLEQTAAALEEITGSITHNTENVIKMSSYAKEVTNSVTNGQQLANETTKAMEEINTQVSSINEAITVIDLIAFQTNILSLNAAVEAATAGEAGKGFAVVAQEVRNLASRSAEAAQEIKQLVENATLKANDGKSIADEMIKGYSTLHNNISQTIDLIEDVKSASEEQRSGIEQINNAVAMLDQQTQKNANIASNTAQIAKETRTIANYIVEDVNEKKF